MEWLIPGIEAIHFNLIFRQEKKHINNRAMDLNLFWKQGNIQKKYRQNTFKKRNGGADE